MKSKKPSLYDAQEEQIQLQSASFVDFLTRKGVLEDHNIDNERVRKAKKDTAQRAYHNTEVLLSQYRLIIWVLECIPGELSDELEVPVHDIDALAEKIDIQTSLENARIESRVNAMMKTRYLVDRIHEALAVIRKKPGKLNISSGRVGSVKHETAIGTGQPVQRKDIPMLFEEPPYLCFLPAPTLSQRFQSQDAPESTVLHDRCKKREGVPIVLIGGMTPQIKPCIRFIENSLSVCQPLRNVPRQA